MTYSENDVVCWVMLATAFSSCIGYVVGMGVDSLMASYRAIKGFLYRLGWLKNTLATDHALLSSVADAATRHVFGGKLEALPEGERDAFRTAVRSAVEVAAAVYLDTYRQKHNINPHRFAPVCGHALGTMGPVGCESPSFIKGEVSHD